MKRPVYLLLYLSLFITVHLSSQNQNSKWYFGNKAGLDFMTNPPTVIVNSAMNAFESCSSIADASGNLLFYTDGVTVWNRLNQVMANGTGLAGGISASNSGFIIKQPGSAAIYFIFTLGNAGQSNLNYTTVDMSLAVGMGSVTVKNTYLGPNSTEKLAAAWHCNGRDIWVVSHDYPGNNFRSFLITGSGVNLTPVISSVGTALTGVLETQGCMAISPLGNKLGVTRYCSITSTEPGVELYNFDNSTGIISNPVNLTPPRAMYSCAFSPDGTKLYASDISPTLSRVFQFNLCAGSDSTIVASQYTFAPFPNPSILPAQMRAAIDGKIYVARLGEVSLDVINSPGISGAGCNYASAAQSVAPGSCIWGLPNLMPVAFKLVPFTYTLNQSSCYTASFTAFGTWASCAGSWFSDKTLQWDFGDGASGNANTSALINPVHTYPGPGTYTAQLIVTSPCGFTDTLRQVVSMIAPATASSWSVCSGSPLTLTFPGNTTYTWSTGANSNTLLVTPTVSGTYSVSAINASGCASSHIFSVAVLPMPPILINQYRTACMGSTLSLYATGAVNYTWSTGAYGNNILITVTTNTSIVVTGTASNGCTRASTVSVNLLPSPMITVTGTGSVCAGAAVTLTANGAYSYIWSNGAQSSAVSLNPVSNAIYTVNGIGTNGCTGQQTVAVTVLPSPTITISAPTSSLCRGNYTVITAGGADNDANYTWYGPGSNTALYSGNSFTVSSSVTSVFRVSGSAAGCSGSAMFTLTVLPSPVIQVSGSATVCPGMGTTLTAGGANSYTWSTGDQGSALSYTPLSTAINTVFVTGTDLAGCRGAQLFTVIASQRAAITSFSYEPVCLGTTTVLPGLEQGFTTGGSFSSDVLVINPVSGQLDLSQLTAGIYTVNYQVSSSSCVRGGSSVATVTITPLVPIDLGPPITIAPGSSVTLHALEGTDYNWTSAEQLSCNNCQAPIATPKETTRYCVTAKTEGCKSEGCVDVIVSCEAEKLYSVPNAFSPNNDGKNDEFCLQGWGGCITAFRVLIYDRWGEKVFESTNPDFCWDGSYMGQALAADVYVFLIKAQTKNKTVKQCGNITLIR